MRNEPLDLKAVQKGLLSALVIAGILFVIGLLVIMVSQRDDFYGEIFINGVILTSLFCGGAVAGAAANSGGWQHGTLTGVTGAVVTLAVGLALASGLFNWYETAVRLLFLAFAGAAGGVVGVNLPPLPRRRRQRQRYFGS